MANIGQLYMLNFPLCNTNPGEGLLWPNRDISLCLDHFLRVTIFLVVYCVGSSNSPMMLWAQIFRFLAISVSLLLIISTIFWIYFYTGYCILGLLSMVSVAQPHHSIWLVTPSGRVRVSQHDAHVRLAMDNLM